MKLKIFTLFIFVVFSLFLCNSEIKSVSLYVESSKTVFNGNIDDTTDDHKVDMFFELPALGCVTLNQRNNSRVSIFERNHIKNLLNIEFRSATNFYKSQMLVLTADFNFSKSFLFDNGFYTLWLQKLLI